MSEPHYIIAVRNSQCPTKCLHQKKAFYNSQDKLPMLSSGKLLLTLAHISYYILFQDKNNCEQLDQDTMI